MSVLRILIAGVITSIPLSAIVISADRYETMMKMNPSSFQRLESYREALTPGMSSLFAAMDFQAAGLTKGANEMEFRDRRLSVNDVFNMNAGFGGEYFAFKRKIIIDGGMSFVASRIGTSSPANLLGASQVSASSSGTSQYYRDFEIKEVKTGDFFAYGEIGYYKVLKFTGGIFQKTQPITSVDANGKRIFDYAYSAKDAIPTTSVTYERALYGVNLLGWQTDSLLREGQLDNLRTAYGFALKNGMALKPIMNYYRFLDKYQGGIEVNDIPISGRLRLGVRVYTSHDPKNSYGFSMAGMGLRWYFFRKQPVEVSVREEDGTRFSSIQVTSAYIEAAMSYTNDFAISYKPGYSFGIFLENFPFLLQKFYARLEVNYYDSIILLPFEDTLHVVTGVVWGFSEATFGGTYREIPQKENAN